MYNYTFFHGTALVRLAQDTRTYGIKRYSGNNGYLVNDVAYIYLKHSSKRLTPWSFTFLPEHIKEIAEARKRIKKNIYIVLICGTDGICCLDFNELSQVILIGDSSGIKQIRISRSRGEKYGVSGSDGKLNHKIGNSDFPRKVFYESSN